MQRWAWHFLGFRVFAESTIYGFYICGRAHSFLQKILPNFAGQFAKFCGLPRQNRSYSTTHHGLPFVRPAGIVTLCWVMLAMDKENYLYIFLVLKVQFVKLRCVYLWLCHIATAISEAYSFLQFSLIFLVIKIFQQVKNHTNRRQIFNFYKITRKYHNSMANEKFRSLARNSAAHGKLWALVIGSRSFTTTVPLLGTSLTCSSLIWNIPGKMIVLNKNQVMWCH